MRIVDAIAWVLVVFGGITLAIALLHQWRTGAGPTASADAAVVELYSAPHRRPFYAVITFTPPHGATVRTTVEIGESTYFRAQRTHRLPIRYVVEHPETLDVVGESSLVENLVVVGADFLVAIALALGARLLARRG